MTRRNMRHEPPEVAALLNPALIALLIVRAARGHLQEAKSALPLVYAPIIVAISLDPAARSALSMNVATQFAVWIQRNTDIQVTLYDKITGVVPLVNEGLLFALAHGALRFEGSGLVPGNLGPTKAIQSDSFDMDTAQRSAAYIGRWFGRTGNPSIVCALLGITP